MDNELDDILHNTTRRTHRDVHRISIRLTTPEAPDLKKIMAVVAKVGHVDAIHYDNF